MQHGKNYDARNVLHVFRLLQMAEAIALTSAVQGRRPNRDFLLQIRRGTFAYAALVAEAEQLIWWGCPSNFVGAPPSRPTP